MSQGTKEGQRWWDRPALPYLMLAASPLLTLPISFMILLSIPDCGKAVVGEPSDEGWELRHFQIALLPALADLLPFLWLVSRTPVVRRAAIVAGLLGSARYAIPQAATLLESMGQFNGGECAVAGYFVGIVLIPIIFILWLVSALAVMLLWPRGARD